MAFWRKKPNPSPPAHHWDIEVSPIPEGAIPSSKIADGAIETARVPDDPRDWDEIGTRVLILRALRQMPMSEEQAEGVAANFQRHALEAAGYGDTYVEDEDFKVVGDWGVDGADDAEHARRKVREALAQYPDCGAHAEVRTVRTWEDDRQFYGAYQPLEPEQ